MAKTKKQEVAGQSQANGYLPHVRAARNGALLSFLYRMEGL
jgi:hypothetical protein